MRLDDQQVDRATGEIVGSRMGDKWAYRAASGSAALAASVFEKRAAIEEELVMMHSPS